MHFAPQLQKFFGNHLNLLGVVFDPIDAGEYNFIARRIIYARQNVEFVARHLQKFVFVGKIENGRSDLSIHHRDDAVVGAWHIAALAECDAVPLGKNVADGLGARAPRMKREGLLIEILPALVLRRHHRKEHEPRDLEQYAKRQLAFLDDRVRRADPKVGLAVDNGLDGKLLLGERGEFVIDATLFGAFQCNYERQGLDRDHIAQRHADLFRRLESACRYEQRAGHTHGRSGEFERLGDESHTNFSLGVAREA